MRRRLGIIGLTSAALLGGAVGSANAAPALRVQVDQKGDFVLIGNTLGFECDPEDNTPMPVVGTVTCGGTGLSDSAPDIFWRADAPMDGQAVANTGVTVAQASSTSVLNIPPGAAISHAYLYWGARRQMAAADTTVTLSRQGGFSQDLVALASTTLTVDGNNFYQSVANVTALVQANGPGAYKVSGIDTTNFASNDNNANFAGWWMVVFYQLATDPPRNLALFDGLDPVNGNQNQDVNLSGFLVPNAGFDAKLGVITYEGDNSIEGDQLFFGGGAPLSNATNPEDNFFNGSRSFLGAPVTVPGDLPQLTGAPQSMSGVDFDVVDVKAKLIAGQKTVNIDATSTGDQYFLAGFITSISTFAPDFSNSDKVAVDLNGGGLLPGDEIEYTINVQNQGNDASINTVLSDPLPAGVTYVPGSIEILSGPNMGTKTDAAADDQGEYNAGTNTVLVRLGVGATGMQGGTLAIGETTVVRFRVTLNANASGTISNQAVINAGGVLGAPPQDTVTDGNGAGNGAPPTVVVVGLCGSDADCAAPTPYCKTAATPNICVACLVDSHCPGTLPTCDQNSNTCVCVPSGSEVCDAIDNNCDGVIDEGCADSDGDGLVDDIEIAIGTNPNDADSDDDGVTDGQEPGGASDSDGDGLINALDPDSDDDGLFDGTELGKDCSGPGVDLTQKSCIPDGDKGATVTDPLDPDTDDGGVKDGAEDSNLNGAIDAGETDPTTGHGADDGDNEDSDGDGLSDGVEGTLGTNPNDSDSDDDGVIDGQEVNPSDDTDGDGLINALDPDSDNDGLKDGTELGKDCSNMGTNVGAGNCVPDADGGATSTSPVDPDTDDGGVTDGSEDSNLNGAIDAGETDPTTGHGADDSTVMDSDGDGLSDGVEGTLGTDPNDADSDNDGVIDGKEPNPSDDTDGDGTINALDPDSDGDGLKDGTEMGEDCSNPATDAAAGNCVPDADGGTTKTSPLDPDTDDGGVKDGDEDTNKNGAIDPGEKDPNDPADDALMPECTTDADCGGPKSGRVCDDTSKTCGDGCRGADGNGCPNGRVCSSKTATIGVCEPMGGTGGGDPLDGVYVEGNGLFAACSTRSGATSDGAGWLIGAAVCALLGRRRRRAA